MNIQEMKKEYEKIYGNEGVSKNDIELIEKNYLRNCHLILRKLQSFTLEDIWEALARVGTVSRP